MMKICWISDFDFKSSGYANISTRLCTELANRGCEIKAVGLNYLGEEHTFPFSIVPTRHFQEILAITQNLYNLWGFDFLVVALDIPIQEQIFAAMKTKPPFKYVGIMPIEADPLCMDWALVLMQMDKPLVISKFGTEEAHKAGVAGAEYLPIGMDINEWFPPAPSDRQQLRKAVGLDDETFAVLTVAENQERKLLSRSLEVFAELLKRNPERKMKYLLVTREHSMVGWRLRSLAQELGINDKLMIFEKGMPQKQLWALYAAADVFLLTTKAEGLGMPVLEAQACGVPVVATDCTAVSEHLGGGKGIPIKYDYTIRDPFGNGVRYYASIEDAVYKLEKLLNGENKFDTTPALQYARSHTWDVSTDKLMEVLEDFNVKKE